MPEILVPALDELETAYRTITRQRDFRETLAVLLSDYAGRPTPLYYAENLSRRLRCRVYLKREDLLHSGAHKINNTLGQALLARKMGKKRVVAETGAGQHGVATALACALFRLDCVVYMGKVDMARQKPNVYRMKLFGARVVPVSSGSRTLKDAINEAMRDWVANVADTHYLLGSVVGPHPFPMLVRDFQSVIGREARRQVLKAEGRLPDVLMACVGGGSNSLGLFHPFRNDPVSLVGVEAGGYGVRSGRHAATLCAGRPGVLHGSYSYLLQDRYGQVRETHSVSAGLDYPGVGPAHSFYLESGRARYVTVSDRQALRAFHLLSETEGIIPALESAHALAYLVAKKRDFTDKSVVVCLSGRGDKDLEEVIRREHEEA